MHDDTVIVSVVDVVVDSAVVGLSDDGITDDAEIGAGAGAGADGAFYQSHSSCSLIYGNDL